MAQDHSMDIVCKVDAQEVQNAVMQSHQELTRRYDLKDANVQIDWDPKAFILTIVAADAFQVGQVKDILISKLIKRGVGAKTISERAVEGAGLGQARQVIDIQQGIPQEKAKALSKQIKTDFPKVQTQIQGDQLRVISKKIDDLQAVIQWLRGDAKLDFHVECANFR